MLSAIQTLNSSTPSIVLAHEAEIINAIQMVMSVFSSLKNNLSDDITCTLDVVIPLVS